MVGLIGGVIAEPEAPPKTQSASTGGGVALRARSLYRKFDIARASIEVLRGVDLDIYHEEKLFLRGASGAGKTTLLYTLAGLERPDSGTVEIDGESLYSLSKGRQAEFRSERIGYVFQHYFLLPDLTALENVCLPSMIAGRRAGRREHGRELLAKVGLGERLDHRPAELSGGEQQRVAIARALMNDPEILFADEPTGNLDSKTGGEVMETLLNVVDEARKTLIVVTHDSKLASLGDRQLVLADGIIVS